MGGWIASVLRRPHAMLENHLQVSAAAAALAAMHAGPYAPSAEEVEGLLLEKGCPPWMHSA